MRAGLKMSWVWRLASGDNYAMPADELVWGLVSRDNYAMACNEPESVSCDRRKELRLAVASKSLTTFARPGVARRKMS